MVTNGGSTGGMVAAVPASSSNCVAGYYPADSTVTLIQSTNTDYTFAGWSGAASGTSTSVPVDMQNVNPDPTVKVTATFNRNCYTLTTTVTPSGGGAVSLSPISSSGCSAGQYYSGEIVQLTAVRADSTYAFSSWSGAASGSSNPTTIVMPTAATSATARFNRPCVTAYTPIQVASTQVGVVYDNYTGSTRNITQIKITWGPTGGGNKKFTQVDFGTAASGWSLIWSGNENSSPKTITSDTQGWNSSGNTGILDRTTKTLLLTFNFDISASNVSVTTWFDDTAACSP